MDCMYTCMRSHDLCQTLQQACGNALAQCCSLLLPFHGCVVEHNHSNETLEIENSEVIPENKQAIPHANTLAQRWGENENNIYSVAL